MSGCRFGRLRISIHAPQWGATATPSPSLSSFVISIHAPQWGATVPYGCVFGVVVISIHAPQWGATRAALEPWARVANFNPRTPVGCDCPAFVTMRRTLIFQSTHPSGVRRHHVGRRRRAGPISIHAPQWGATAQRMVPRLPTRFQSTHPSGVRRPDRSTSRDVRGHFNPRTPVGCDAVCVITMATDLFQSTHPSGVRRADGQGRGRPLQISIHAPQWGATWRWRRNVATPKPFQSTHPSGVRLTLLGMITEPLAFQSTHPSGVRPPDWDKPAYTALFQSTHPSGVRPTPAGCTVKHYQISIHAPQWGATGLLFAITCDTPYFNPRTPVGCDLVFGVPATASSLFQSTHPSGVRPPRICWTSSFSNFNPRTPVGCDGVS